MIPRESTSIAGIKESGAELGGGGALSHSVGFK